MKQRAEQHFFESAGGKAGEVVGGAVDVYPNPVKQIRLPLEVDKMNALLGTNVSKEEVLEYFGR
ncbi:hypothetical protein, partial [Terrisporobacter mayombei]|uniref:hypothetical protein n=1 Tax=Terrisporobacter mayombei TaxID=1541 RepID=UPI00265A66AA